MENGKKYAKVSIVAVLIAILICIKKTIWVNDSIRDLFSDLSDVFLIPGMIILGYAILVYATGEGFFDGFGYSFKSIKRNFMKDPTEKEDYYEYKLKMSKKQRSFKHLFYVGGILVIISVIFLVIYTYLN